MRTLIVGLGRSGLGLHLPVVARLASRELAGRREDAQAPDGPDRHSPGPVVGFDPRPAAREAARRHGLTVLSQLSEAADELPPARTVVHVCTPPAIRLGVLEELAALGFRHILVEKPLAVDRAGIAAIERLRTDRGLDLAVVAPWLGSDLTGRLARLTREGTLGELRSIHVSQLKARFRRTLADRGPLSAFDVEVPHSLGVALRLAGDGRVVDAAWSDLAVDGQVVPRMGTARLVLRHETGVRTEIFSDLGSPSRVRRIRLEFQAGRVVGDFPVSADDEYAQLEVAGTGRVALPDDSLGRFLEQAYRTFAAGAGRDTGVDYATNVRVARLLCDAKERCLDGEPPAGPVRSPVTRGAPPPASPPTSPTVVLPYRPLRELTAGILAALGLPDEPAEVAAGALLYGDLSGMSSHGLANLGRLYLPLLESGRVDPKAVPDVATDRGAAVLLDANRSLGLWSTRYAMELAVERAGRYGIGLVSVRNGTHFGCAGYHALAAAECQMVGVVAANCGRQRIARPPGARMPMLGTNPLAVAAPAGTNPPFVLDMSTTVVPTGRIREAARAGTPVPRGWLVDDAGDPVVDPAAFDRGEAHLQWLGGRAETGAYKGYGLALMVEVLAALVPGAGLGPVGAHRTEADGPARDDDDIGYLTLAIAPATLRPGAAFQLDAQALFGALLDCPPSQPGTRVSYPGWHEGLRADRRRRTGVPLAADTYHELCEIAERFGTPMPEPTDVRHRADR